MAQPLTSHRLITFNYWLLFQFPLIMLATRAQSV